METVIPPEKLDGHVVQKYRFKVLSGASRPQEEETHDGGVKPYTFATLEPSAGEEPIAEQESRPVSAETTETEAPVKGEETPSRPDPAMEEMLKKADELSSQLVKMQMQMEKQQREFEERLAQMHESAYAEGLEEGKKQCSETLSKELEEQKTRLAASIQALEESRQRFERKIDTIEEELIETALDLAKEVVVKEIRSDSKEVALRLARLLLREVKEASKVTLKVNPDDYDHLKSRLEPSESLEIVPDPAVGPGGVVILSDVGNIDGEIMHRFERIKEAVFGTGA